MCAYDMVWLMDKKGYAQGKKSPAALLSKGSYGYSITLSRYLRDCWVNFCVSIPKFLSMAELGYLV